MLSSAFNFATTSGEPPAGITIPEKATDSSFGKPSSRTVGTSDRFAWRLGWVVASGRRRPWRIGCSEVDAGSTITGTWPEMASCSAGPLPLYGTCTKRVPYSTLASGPVRCISVPMPGDAYGISAPGLRAASISSPSVFQGWAAPTEITKPCADSAISGARSRCAS